MTKIKICGLKRVEDADYLNEVRADYAGFVFWEKSSRNLSFEKAKEIRSRLHDEIQTVGVFVNASYESIAELVNAGIISCVQMHGSESDDDIRALRDILPKGTLIIKAFEVKSADDVDRANKSIADMVLIDSGKGSGQTFDWSLLAGINREYFLAGGLSTENVADAISKLHPCVVDISSKVETDGFKDQDKIKAFCNTVRKADK